MLKVARGESIYLVGKENERDHVTAFFELGKPGSFLRAAEKRIINAQE